MVALKLGDSPKVAADLNKPLVEAPVDLVLKDAAISGLLGVSAVSELLLFRRLRPGRRQTPVVSPPQGWCAKWPYERALLRQGRALEHPDAVGGKQVGPFARSRLGQAPHT